MPRPASPKRMVYSCKKIMLTMLLVFWAACFWPGQTLMCHSCSDSETCANKTVCAEEEYVCISEIIKIPGYTRVHKMCFTTCQDFLEGEIIENKDINATEEANLIEIANELLDMINKKSSLLGQNTSVENYIICCETDLCNQARARDSEDTALVFGFLLSFMWLIHCSML